MKRLRSLLKPHVIRAIIYSSLTKGIIALALIMLWAHVVNSKSKIPFDIVGTGFFALAVWFVLGAWFQYLSLDGLHPFHMLHIRKKNRSITAMDEEELDEDEAIAAKLLSNLALAALFLIPSLIANSI